MNDLEIPTRRSCRLRQFAGMILVSSSISCHGPVAPATGQTQFGNVVALENMMEQNRQAFAKTEEVDMATVAQGIKDNEIVLIDVRTEEEMQVSILPGAISGAEFERAIDTYAGKRLVGYCTIGYRSAAYAQAMKQRGLSMASFNGGVVAWCQAGYPLSTVDGRETRRVHAYGRKWNLVPSDYEAVW